MCCWTGCASVSWACVAACGARTAAPLCPPHHPSEPNPKAQADAVQDTSLPGDLAGRRGVKDRKSTRLNSSHTVISYAVFCLKKKKKIGNRICRAKGVSNTGK